MRFSSRGRFVAVCLTSAVVIACGSDDDNSGGGEPDASMGGASGGSGGGTPTGGSGGSSGSSTGGGGTGGQAGGSGGGGASAGGAGGQDGGTGCSLACVHGTCVVSGGSESCQCDSVYTGELCDDIAGPPDTDIVLWLDAADDSTTGGGVAGPLTRWEDKSPSALVALAGPDPSDAGADAGDGGVDASAPGPADAGDASPEAGLGDDVPTLRVDGTSGRRYLSFDGNDCMRLGAFAGLTSQDAYTIFLVVYGTPTRQPVLSGTTAAGNGLLIETTATSYRFLHRMPFGGTGGDSLPGAFAFSQTELDLVTLWRSTTEQAMRRPGNAAETTAVSSAAFDVDVELTIGCLRADSPTRYLVGELGEILLYQGALAEPDKSAIEDYLSRKWLGSSL